MAVHRFEVKIANPTAGDDVAELRIEAVPEADLLSLGYELPPERLELRSVRLSSAVPASTLGGCLEAIRSFFLDVISWLLRRPIPTKPLFVRLTARSETFVRVNIKAAGPRGSAAVRVIDRRNGQIVGGVTLLALSGVEDQRIEAVRPANPCPIALVSAPYWVPPGTEASAPPDGGPLPAGYEVDLIAWVTNPTESTIDWAVAYLEHLGGSLAEFTLTTWNLGSFEPKATFPLRWRVRTQPEAEGYWDASIVVTGSEMDPVRLLASYEIARPAPVEDVRSETSAVEPA